MRLNEAQGVAEASSPDDAKISRRITGLPRYPRQMEPREQDPAWDQFKQRAKVAWGLGDYAKVAELLQPAADRLVEACSISEGMEVLDVAAGTGNVAIAAAKKGARVVASDMTAALVELGKRRSRAEGVAIDWFEADAEDLPFEADRFDCVTSAFGVIFAPRAALAASQLFRVATNGGLVGMTNWTPEGYSGQLFSRMAKHLPAPPQGSDPPARWGDPAVVRERFQPFASSVECEIERITFRWECLPAAREYIEGNTGAVVAAKRSMAPEQYEAMVSDLVSLTAEFSRGSGDEVVVDSEYLLVVARKGSS